MINGIKIGYATGVFDMFHIGHLNLLRRAKENCDYLIVGVSTDELVKEYKNKETIIPFEERMQIVQAIKYVDKVVPQTSMNKMNAYKKFKFTDIFVGDDWKGTQKWEYIEYEFSKIGVKVNYLPYTKDTSSSILRDVLYKSL